MLLFNGLILFLISNIKGSKSNNSSESCGHLVQPKECHPPFMNIAENLTVHSTSTCGQLYPEKLLTNLGYDYDICNARKTDKNHEPSLLTDPHNLKSPTCWASGSIKAGEWVNLTFNLGRRFEIYYVNVEGCENDIGEFPDAIAIYKSLDFGKTWLRWHFFSTDCFRAFGMPTNEAHTSITNANIDEVLCVPLKPGIFAEPRFPPRPHSRKRRNGLDEFPGDLATKNNRLRLSETFSTTIGRPRTEPWSPILVDWISATDVKISLMKFEPDPNKVSQNVTEQSFASRRKRNTFKTNINYFSLSNVVIGGRCKCNGHSNQCVRNAEGKLVCICEHNTSGDDCEHCDSGYMDKPWSRASNSDPHVCQKCDCNFHSDKCRFSNSHYVDSKRQSGGFCENCLHNTIGRKCHLCAEGFYRDWTKPSSHSNVCKACDCNEMGRLNGTICNPATGECQCREGVTGPKCNTCLYGYVKSLNSNEPCVKEIGSRFVVRDSNHLLFRSASQEVPSSNFRDGFISQPFLPCLQCEANNTRVGIRKFCRRDAIFMATVKSMESPGDSVKYDLLVSNVWREPTVRGKQWPNINAKGERIVRAWVNIHDHSCPCPTLSLGSVYIFLAQAGDHPENFDISLGPGPGAGSAVLYDPAIVQKLDSFQNSLRTAGFDSFCSEALRSLELARRRRRIRRGYPFNQNPTDYQNNFYRARFYRNARAGN